VETRAGELSQSISSAEQTLGQSTAIVGQTEGSFEEITAAVEGAAEPDGFFDAVQSRLGVPVIGDPNASVLDAGWFYDTNFHLNASGKTVYTRLLIRNIKAMLGDSSPTDIAIPAQPEPEQAERWAGDDSYAGCVVLEDLGGWNTSTIAEDAEFASQLARAGYQVAWVPEAVNYDEEPTSFRVSLHQRKRWCSGLMQVARRTLHALWQGESPAPLRRWDMTMFLAAPFAQAVSGLLLLSGLQNISKSYYEAASIDGAGKVTQFFHITLPMVSPTLFGGLIMRLRASGEVSAVLTVPTYLPLRRTVHRSETAMISESLWEMKRILLPSAARFFMICMSS